MPGLSHKALLTDCLAGLTTHLLIKPEVAADEAIDNIQWCGATSSCRLKDIWAAPSGLYTCLLAGVTISFGQQIGACVPAH